MLICHLLRSFSLDLVWQRTVCLGNGVEETKRRRTHSQPFLGRLLFEGLEGLISLSFAESSSPPPFHVPLRSLVASKKGKIVFSKQDLIS